VAVAWQDFQQGVEFDVRNSRLGHRGFAERGSDPSAGVVTRRNLAEAGHPGLLTHCNRA